MSDKYGLYMEPLKRSPLAVLRFKELIHLKCLEQWLAQNTQSININFHLLFIEGTL
jgi:hypothetical protein